jgi:transposase
VAKYSEGFKLMLVKEYLEGKLGYRLLAQKYDMKDFTRILRWVKVYEKFGEKGLMRKKNKETYSVQFKLDVLSFMKRTGSSEADTALQFGLTNPSMIASCSTVKFFRMG